MMLKKDIFSICSFYAVSPIHAGSGASLAAVDLPIQRERHTNWPHIQSSAVKGAMRSHYRDFSDDKKLVNFIFGYDSQDNREEYKEYIREKPDLIKEEGESFPGAVAFSDAKLLAFPMRSNIAPFVWVICPAILKRLSRDLEFAKLGKIEINYEIKNDEAVAFFNPGENKKIILEDTVVTVSKVEEKGILFIKNHFQVMDKLLLIADDIFKYCVDSCTEIQTQIKINSATGTARDGALRYQEFLPADSVLYSVVFYSASSFENSLQAENIKTHLQQAIKDFIQIGGDETLGKGICKMEWIDGGVL